MLISTKTLQLMILALIGYGLIVDWSPWPIIALILLFAQLEE